MTHSAPFRQLCLALAIAHACARTVGAQDSTRVSAPLARIDFQDADLRAVITAIAEAGGLNLTYGDFAPRRVTLHLPQGLSRADMLPLLRSIASSNGLRVVADGTLLRVETADARTSSGMTTSPREGVQVFVYRLKHARAARLATTLQSLYGGRTADLSGASYGLSSRPLSEQLRATQLPPMVADTTLNRPVPANTAAVLQGAVQGEIQVVPDETTNSLLIRAQPADYETIRQAIDALDLRPLQVFIEVLIAEVRRTRGFDLGVTASATRDASGNITTGSLTSTTPDNFLVRFSRGGNVNIDVALSALASQGDVRILSRPLILAENNLEARILVGSQRPFVQVFRSLPTDAGVRDQIVQYRDVGTSLSLIPTINPDGYVNLQVKQEVSSATNELQFGAPVISTREASTHLFVKDAQTVVIGGLADRQTERTRSGIPLLSSIPGIGGLFGATSNTDSQSELYLFLTPHIVTNDDEAETLRKAIESRLENVGGESARQPRRIADSRSARSGQANAAERKAMTVSLAGIQALSPRLAPEFMEEQGVLPLELANGLLALGTWRDDVASDAIAQIEVAFDARVRLDRVDEDQARQAIRRLYGETSAQSLIDTIGDRAAVGTDAQPAIDDLRALANEAPVIRLVSMLLSEALESRASDVHLEAYSDALRVRYRVDGVLQEAPSPPRAMAPAIVSRLKVMADLDIAERRMPQDGRIRLTLQDRQVDVRVSTIPTLHGESVVLRLLDREAGNFNLDTLGMDAGTLSRFAAVLKSPNGVVLATGPTGSGKTTTLYAALVRLRTGREKIVTVEDPVEYQLEGIPQVPVNEKVGVTFASALRALLRQDPDVMLVGEIRDRETAEIATQAALTGHLVLSTLHTNDAIGALARLVDLGVEPFLVSATVNAVIAQRLVRTTCTACGTWMPSTAHERAALSAADLENVHRGGGCEICKGTGYVGRTGVYELLVVDEAMRAGITSGASAAAIRAMAEQRGMQSLAADGVRLVREGRTTPEEVLRVAR